MKFETYNNALHTMYPSTSQIIESNSTSFYHEIPEGASIYCFVISGSVQVHSGNTTKTVLVDSGFVIAAASTNRRIFIEKDTKIWIVTRHGFKVPLTITMPEYKGRLTYIDGCSDTLLVYPPRKGDGSLSLLYFPKNINQSWHSHPSIRLGYVASGCGVAEWLDSDGLKQSALLKVGDSFMLDEQISHRFCTETSEMRILAYHPDGDWGPEDKNHTMLNRTYLK